MESIARPQKPNLEYQEHLDSNGVIVRSLTPESEQVWSRYLHADYLARIAIYRSENEGKEQVSNS